MMALGIRPGRDRAKVVTSHRHVHGANSANTILWLNRVTALWTAWGKALPPLLAGAIGKKFLRLTGKVKTTGDHNQVFPTHRPSR